MRAAKLSSSLISRIAYLDDERMLKLWFRDGPLYCYFEVPAELFDALKASPSPGRHYNEHVKGRYRCSFDPARKRFRPAARAAGGTFSNGAAAPAFRRRGAAKGFA